MLRLLVQRAPRRTAFASIRCFSSGNLRGLPGQPHKSPRSAHLDTEGRTLGFARRRAVRQDAQTQRPAAQGPSENADSASASNSVSLSQALQNDDQDASGLHAPVIIPYDPQGILSSNHPSTSILANPSIVIQRQIEMLNVFMGFEQANRYIIMSPDGDHIGYLAEQDHGFGNSIARQAFRTHRSFTAHVFDKDENEVLRFHRPFSWISSKIRVYDTTIATTTAAGSATASSTSNNSNPGVSSLHLSEMRIIGEAQQQWAPLRRKYNLFLHRDLSNLPADPHAPQLASGTLPLSESTQLQKADGSNENFGFAQFAYVNEPFLSWDFSLLSEDQKLIGSVNRNFVGFARELFTDTGVYALRMDSAGAGTSHEATTTSTKEPIESRNGMTLDQRAVMLATAVSIDFDYFSRHSHAGAGGFMPLWIPWGGGAGAEAGAAAGTVGAAGAAGAEATGAGVGAAEAGSVARGAASSTGALGAGEGAIAGAGSLAGYDALQRSRENRQENIPDAPLSPNDFSSPQNQSMHDGYSQAPEQQQQQNEDYWGSGWSNEQHQDDWPGGPGSSRGGGEEDGGGGGVGGSGGDGGGAGGSGGGDGGSFFDNFF